MESIRTGYYLVDTIKPCPGLIRKANLKVLKNSEKRSQKENDHNKKAATKAPLLQ